MNIRVMIVLFLALCSFGCTTKVRQTPVSSIKSYQILKDVQWLASDEMQGRYYRSNEARHAAKYIADRWKAAGLQPLPDQSSMYLPTGNPLDSPNVAAIWQGTGDDYVLVTAHYDHLRPRRRGGDDKIFNGADDNASGTAALLSIGDALQFLHAPLGASVVLVAFTGEEAGLVGSKHFASHAPIPLENIRGLINLDMISRGSVNTIFLEGTPDAPILDEAIKNANKHIGLNIVRDMHPDWLYRSDQAPFLKQGVPSVFFSVEDHEDYHRVTDHADKILPLLAAKTTQLTLMVVIDLAQEPSHSPD